MDEQARRRTSPNRVRHPAGCSFASGCSPPRLAADAVAFGYMRCDVHMTRTPTLLTNQHHGRTHPRACPEDPTLRLLRTVGAAGALATANNRTECAERWILGTRPRMTPERCSSALSNVGKRLKGQPLTPLPHAT